MMNSKLNSLQLPILEVLPKVREALASESCLIVQAPPGAGKSTALPLALLSEGWLEGQRIIMLEPRRLAAKSVAMRMADVLGERLGETVGYTIRFEKKVGPNTRIEVVTEGVLNRRLQQDNTLDGVGAVIFDEFHERSIYADTGLALCREVQQLLRPELRLIVMSATFDSQGIAELLEATVVESKGRQYPIEERFLPQQAQLPIAEQVANGIRHALMEFEGDVLAFLPGVGEIHRALELLQGVNADCLPLHGQLSFKEQQAAILPYPQGRRKVVLSTSIAETSLTIEGVRVVVDSGWTRRPRFDRNTGFTQLETVRVAKDVATQRAGRAGRLGPGNCIKLWSKLEQQHLEERFPPEITVADLAPLLLELGNWGIYELAELSWLTPPPSAAIQQGKALLKYLGAFDKDGKLSVLGQKMSSFPAHPRVAKLLTQSKDMGLEREAALLAAVLEERDPMNRQKSGVNISTRLQALTASGGRKGMWARHWKAAEAWMKLMKAQGPVTSLKLEKTGQLLALAYPDRIAKQLEPHGIRYQLATGEIVRLPEQDALTQEPWLVIAHLDMGTAKHGRHADGKAFLAASLSIEKLDMDTEVTQELHWDLDSGQLIAKQSEKIGVLELRQEPLEQIDEELKRQALGEAIRKQPQWLPWTEEVGRWQARVESIRVWRKEDGWPEVSKNALLQRLEDWLLPFVPNIRQASQLKKVNLLDLLPALLTYEQQQALSQIAPERIKVPSGSQIRLQYSADGSPPVLSVRLQELFGMSDTPMVDGGRKAVLIHLLSPGYKPVQVTQDLRSFWDNTYIEVRKELRRRYPKHAWPENPWEAEAIRGVPRRKKK